MIYQVDHEHTTVSEFGTCSRDVIDIFPCLKKTLTLAFLGQHESKIFQNLHDYNLARGLHVHCRFDDVDFVSGSHAF